MEDTGSSSEKEDEPDDLKERNHSNLQSCLLEQKLNHTGHAENLDNLNAVLRVEKIPDERDDDLKEKEDESSFVGETQNEERQETDGDIESGDIKSLGSEINHKINDEPDAVQINKAQLAVVDDENTVSFSDNETTREKDGDEEITDPLLQVETNTGQESQDVQDGFLKFLKMCAGGKAKLFDEDDEVHGFDEDSKSNRKKSKRRNRPQLLRSTPLSVHYKEASAFQFKSQLVPEKNNPEPSKQSNSAKKAPTEIKPQQETRMSSEIVDENQYNFSFPQRGHLVLIVNDKFLRQSSRQGANWDLVKTKQIASKLGFRIFNTSQHRNLTKKETIAVLREAQHHDHSDSDCFMFVISTHGLERPNPSANGKLDHVLVCSDDQFIFTSSILDMFSDRNCPTLKNKPKMFFIQACRGEKYDEGSNIRVIKSNRSEDKIDIAGTFVPPPSRDGQRRQRSQDVTDTKASGDSWAPNYRTTANAQLNHPIRSHIGDSGSYSTNDPHNETNLFEQYSTARVWSTGGYHAANQNQRQPTTSQTLVENNPRENITPRPFPVNETPSLQCDNDFLVMYAIPPGHFAWRNTADGSWMLDYLHKTVMAYNMKKPVDFLKLLRKVSWRMSMRQTNTPSDPRMHEKKAISVIEHKLDKDIVFKPKAVMSGWMRADTSFLT